ncbi:MAG TPA: hypothetical protein VII33_02540 [Nakamurella sp.]
MTTGSSVSASRSAPVGTIRSEVVPRSNTPTSRPPGTGAGAPATRSMSTESSSVSRRGRPPVSGAAHSPVVRPTKSIPVKSAPT